MSSPRILRLFAALLAAAAIGCSTQDDRYVELSQQSVARQAEQNQQVTRQSQQVAEAAHELVQADAQARVELVAAQRSLQEGLQAERSNLDYERDKLEQDRRALAAAKEREPVVAQTIWSAALLVAVVLPLVLCIYLIRTLGTNEPGHDLNELLIYELTAEQPTLLPSTPMAVPRLEQAAAEPAGKPAA
jgi:hypothetical protein